MTNILLFSNPCIQTKSSNEKNDLLCGNRNSTGIEMKFQSLKVEIETTLLIDWTYDDMRSLINSEQHYCGQEVIYSSRTSSCKMLRLLITFSIGTFVSLVLDASLTFQSDEMRLKCMTRECEKNSYPETVIIPFHQYMY